MTTTSEKEFTYTCRECGQKNDIGLCTRCDRVCARCRQNLRNHYLIEGLHFCPSAVFEDSGNISEP